MTDNAQPGLGVLRVAGANLMVDRLGESFRAAMEAGVQVRGYFLAAAAVGVPREVALEILHETQAARAGSTPTPADLEAARAQVLLHAISGPVSMSDDLRATVAHLAATTQYGRAALIAAVQTLRGLKDSWPDERIIRTLPVVAAMAPGSPYSPAEVAQMIRQVSP